MFPAISRCMKRILPLSFALIVTAAYFSHPALQVSAEGYISQRVTVNTATAPLRIGGGNMYIAADNANAGESFAVESSYVDADDNVWFEVEKGGRLLWISKSDCSIETTTENIEYKTFSSDNLPTIYISPSRQPHNLYAWGSTNEMEQMEALADDVAEILRSEYGFTVYVAPSYMRIIRSGRPTDALNKGCDIYLAVHSNATGTGALRRGAEAYYYSGSAQSKLLAENLVSCLDAASDYETDGAAGAVSAMECFDNFGYGEVREPSDMGMIAVLAEVDYHDNPETARMIIQKRQDIAEAIVEAIVITFIE